VKIDMSEKILIVDDEKAIADLVEVYLKNDGYQVFKFYNATEALACVEKENLSLAVLDVMLPDMDGFTLCRRIRENHLYPIIMLTAKVEDVDKITGLTLGADDYITKPFNPLELMARVKTQLRRYTRYNASAEAAVPEKEEIDIRGLHISKNSHKCTLNGKELGLTPLEFSILWYLCERKGNVVSSEDLFEAVWGEKYLDNNNTVMAHIARLRERMNEPARKPKYVKTVWGVGYTIE
jgi:Response regulators consisting of a CheY-like receiver domain and a winged-helix DNA-binding domain